MLTSPFYDVKKLRNNFLWFVALVLVCKFTKGAAFAVMIPVLLLMLSRASAVGVMNVLLIAVTAMMMNGYFLPHGFAMAVSQKVLLLMAAGFLSVQAFGRKAGGYVTPMLGLLPYLVYMAFVSQSGWCPVISNLKLLLFTMVFFALYGGAVRTIADRCDLREVRLIVLVNAVWFVFGSMVLIPFPGIGMMGADELLESGGAAVSLFKGMTKHSQALGPMIAMLGTLLFADLLLSIRKKEKLYYGLILCCPILIYRTSSRTALASYGLGMMFLTFFAMRMRDFGSRWRKRLLNGLIGVCFVAGLAVLIVPQLRDKALGFVVKYNGDEVLEISSEQIWASRQGKLNDALQNWHAKPMTGNGFQVSEEMQWKEIDGIRDVLTAPVEKSTWTYAILEEGGVMGMIIFSGFVLTAILTLIRKRAYIGATMFFEFLMINMGEFTIFSMSALGGYCWCLIFIGLILDSKRIREEQRQLAALQRPPPMMPAMPMMTR